MVCIVLKIQKGPVVSVDFSHLHRKLDRLLVATLIFKLTCGMDSCLWNNWCKALSASCCRKWMPKMLEYGTLTLTQR